MRTSRHRRLRRLRKYEEMVYYSRFWWQSLQKKRRLASALRLSREADQCMAISASSGRGVIRTLAWQWPLVTKAAYAYIKYDKVGLRQLRNNAINKGRMNFLLRCVCALKAGVASKQVKGISRLGRISVSQTLSTWTFSR